MDQEKNDVKLQIKENINLLINSGQLEEAKVLIEEYKKIVTNDMEIYSMNAIILIMKDKLEEAEIVLKKGLEKDNNNFDLLYNLGYLYERKNNIIEANVIYNILDILNDKIELKEEIEYKMLQNGSQKTNYNVMLFGEYNECLKLKEYLKDWNVIAICNDNNTEKVIKPSELTKYNYDFIFAAEYSDKEAVYKKLRKYNNKNIYFMEDFRSSIIEGLDYRFLELLCKKEIDGIITGLSYAEVGIKQELLPYNFINFAFSAQDLFYDFLLLKYLLNFEEVKVNLKYVIINLAYYSFDYDMTKTISKYRIHRYSRYFKDYHNNSDIIGIDTTKIFYDRRITFQDYISMNKMKEKSILNINDENGVYEAKRNSSMDYEDTRSEYEKILESYIDFLQKNNIKPIIIVCPTSSHYRKYFDNNKKNVFYNILNKINKNNNFQIIDYFQSDLFKDDDFWDFSHLNAKGAEKFTKILNEEIEW